MIAFEPQPGCAVDIHVSQALNNAEKSVTVVDAPVSQNHFEVFIPSTGCNNGLQAASLTTIETTTVSRLTTTIDEHIKDRPVHFVKNRN